MMITVITDEFACDLDQIQYVYVGSANTVIQAKDGNTIAVTREVGKATIDKMVVKATIDKMQYTKVSCCDNEDEINTDKEPYRIGSVLDPVEYQAALEGCGLRTGLWTASPVEAKDSTQGWFPASKCRTGVFYITYNAGLRVMCVQSGTTNRSPLFLVEGLMSKSNPRELNFDLMREAASQSW